jgi:Family of unknown function (DUF5695)
VDAYRARTYVAPFGLWLTLDAGRFDRVEVNTKTGVVRIGLAPATQFTTTARLHVEQPAKLAGIGEYNSVPQLKRERGAYVVPLGKTVTWVELSAHP